MPEPLTQQLDLVKGGRSVSQIDLYNVTSNLSMETMKRETALPL